MKNICQRAMRAANTGAIPVIVGVTILIIALTALSLCITNVSGVHDPPPQVRAGWYLPGQTIAWMAPDNTTGQPTKERLILTGRDEDTVPGFPDLCPYHQYENYTHERQGDSYQIISWYCDNTTASARARQTIQGFPDNRSTVIEEFHRFPYADEEGRNNTSIRIYAKKMESRTTSGYFIIMNEPLGSKNGDSIIMYYGVTSSSVDPEHLPVLWQMMRQSYFKEQDRAIAIVLEDPEVQDGVRDGYTITDAGPRCYGRTIGDGKEYTLCFNGITFDTKTAYIDVYVDLEKRGVNMTLARPKRIPEIAPPNPDDVPELRQKAVSIRSVSRQPDNRTMRVSGLTDLPPGSALSYEIMSANVITHKATTEEVCGTTGTAIASRQNITTSWSADIDMSSWRNGRYSISVYPKEDVNRKRDTREFYLPLEDTISQGAGKDAGDGTILLNEPVASTISAGPVTVTPLPTPPDIFETLPKNTIIIQAVPDHIVGDTFGIRGITNLPPDETFLVEVSSPNQMGGPKERERSGMTCVIPTKHESGNVSTWDVIVDTDDYLPDKYQVIVSSYHYDAQAQTQFNLSCKQPETIPSSENSAEQNGDLWGVAIPHPFSASGDTEKTNPIRSFRPSEEFRVFQNAPAITREQKNLCEKILVHSKGFAIFMHLPRNMTDVHWTYPYNGTLRISTIVGTKDTEQYGLFSATIDPDRETILQEGFRNWREYW